jgi:hypothetical protein
MPSQPKGFKSTSGVRRNIRPLQFRNPRPTVRGAAAPPRTPIFGRGPRELQHSLYSGQQEARPFPPLPPWFRAAHPVAPETEWALYWVATSVRGMVEGVDFYYQDPFRNHTGGATAGSTIVDFVFPYHGIAINPLGTYWHYQQGPEQQARDLLSRAALAERDLLLIFIDEPDVLRAPIWYFDEALAGRDYSVIGNRGG